MIQISVKHDLASIVRMLDDKQRNQVPFATAKTLTGIATKGKAAGVEEMKRVFDRPTPFTLKSLYIKPATKRDLTAMVYVKDRPAGKNPRSIAEILGHEYAGGQRLSKSIEYWLRRAGLISPGEYVVPGAGAKIDQYGNMARSQIIQIMSQLALGNDPYAWKSKSARSRRNVKRAGQFFWSRGGHLKRGVWVRDGRHVHPILVVVGSTTYRRRMDLEKTVQRIIDRDFDADFQRNLAEAERTAR